MTKQAYIDKTLSEKLSVKLIMDTWTLKKGYPVVMIDRDYENNKAKLKEHRNGTYHLLIQLKEV